MLREVLQGQLTYPVRDFWHISNWSSKCGNSCPMVSSPTQHWTTFGISWARVIIFTQDLSILEKRLASYKNEVTTHTWTHLWSQGQSISHTFPWGQISDQSGYPNYTCLKCHMCSISILLLHPAPSLKEGTRIMLTKRRQIQKWKYNIRQLGREEHSQRFLTVISK